VVLPETRSGWQEGVAPRPGQRFLAHLRRGQRVDHLPQPAGQEERARSTHPALLASQEESPWLNPIEPKWIHGKRRVVQADGGLLSAHELADRVCAAFDCPHYEHLAVTENVA
jgi:hypothetical protein